MSHMRIGILRILSTLAVTAAAAGIAPAARAALAPVPAAAVAATTHVYPPGNLVGRRCARPADGAISSV
jgi:hypothetical protein